MRRRSRAGGKSAKLQRRKTTTPERRNASKAVRRADPSVAELQARLERQARELSEAREQQTATAEVLRVISGSPSDLKPVFRSMLEKATRLCEASFGTLFLREGESCRRVALHNAPAKYAEFTDK